jgi:cobalt-precorrin-5B (C1)-methyltransferase
MIPIARPGYTLPVFASAAAIAALQRLRQAQPQPCASVLIDLIEPPTTAVIPIEQVALLDSRSALAMTRSDPGDNLDLTRNMSIWAVVAWGEPEQTEAIALQAGEGVGRQIHADDQPAIYTYARRLLQVNLERYLEPGEKIQVTIILPEGKALAQRTSNAAFGVVEGLSLLGTTGISQPLSAPGQLEAYREALQQKSNYFDCLVFCVGENGLDLATKLGVDPARIVKTANWLGPLLVEAGVQQVQAILLFGYHGKLIKLAGGIFHTHHHLADARQEILTAHCANLGLPTSDVQVVFASSTTESALKYLRDLDAQTNNNWVNRVYEAIAHQIDRRSNAYIYNHSERQVQVGSALFDRDRQMIIKSQTGSTLMSQVC